MPGPGLSRWFATRRRRDIPASCPRRSRAGNPGTLERPSTSTATLAASPERRFLPANHRHDRRSRRRNWSHCAAGERSVSAVATTFFVKRANSLCLDPEMKAISTAWPTRSRGAKNAVAKDGMLLSTGAPPFPLEKISERSRMMAAGDAAAETKKRGRSLAFITASLPFD